MAFKAELFGGLKFETVDKSRLSETHRFGTGHLWSGINCNGFKDL